MNSKQRTRPTIRRLIDQFPYALVCIIRMYLPLCFGLNDNNETIEFFEENFIKKDTRLVGGLLNVRLILKNGMKMPCNITRFIGTCVDTSKCTSFKCMFQSYVYFTGKGIEGWDTSNVTNMSFMFCRASKFNCNIGKWLVSSVVNMNNMFSRATSFNCDLRSWDLPSLIHMNNMFYCAYSLDYELIWTWY